MSIKFNVKIFKLTYSSFLNYISLIKLLFEIYLTYNADKFTRRNTSTNFIYYIYTCCIYVYIKITKRFFMSSSMYKKSQKNLLNLFNSMRFHIIYYMYIIYINIYSLKRTCPPGYHGNGFMELVHLDTLIHGNVLLALRI